MSQPGRVGRFLLFFLLALAPVAVSAGPVVQIEGGRAEGRVSGGVSRFFGLPFAAPPVGVLRWRPPHPAEPWAGIRDAGDFGPVCPQNTNGQPDWVGAHYRRAGMSEDCLTLNIWTPARLGDSPATAKRPVMVYIHGGNMRRGAGSRPDQDGTVLAKAGVVVVTTNYRIGMLGRFAHPAMSRVQAGEALGNYGFMDQIAALEWVQRNICVFGGDPDNVTIFGHSAGGVSVNVMLAIPQSRGLFQKAIAQGSAITIDKSRHISRPGMPGPFEKPLEAVGVEFADDLGVHAKTDAEIVAGLRALSVEDILEYQDNPLLTFNPVVDGRLITDDLAKIFERGEQHDVPYIGGANSWEWNQIADVPLIGKWFLATEFLRGLTTEDLAVFDDQWTRIGVSQRWFAEGLFLTSTRYLAAQMSRGSAPAWLYHATYLPVNLRGELPGAVHGIEVPFVFGVLRRHPEYNRPRPVELTAEDYAWGDTVRGYWLSFAKTGSPNGGGRPVWPRYGPDSDEALVLGPEIAPRSAPHSDTLDFLERRALLRRGRFEADAADR